MAASWENYQAILAVAVGVNVAIFGLPTLGQPVLEAENRRWTALLQLARGAPGANGAAIRAGMIRFRETVRELEAAGAAFRRFALWMGGLATLVLVCTSGVAAETPNGPILWGTLVANAVPTLGLIGLNERARRRIADLAVTRGMLQADCERAP